MGDLPRLRGGGAVAIVCTCFTWVFINSVPVVSEVQDFICGLCSSPIVLSLGAVTGRCPVLGY